MARVSSNSTQMDLWVWLVSPNPQMQPGTQVTMQFYRVADNVDAQTASSLSFIGKTSAVAIGDDGCAVFAEPASAEFVFETRQTLVGYVTAGRGGNAVSTPPFALGELISSRGHTLEYELTGGGRVRITASERNRNAADVYQLRFAASDIPKKNVFSGTDSYLRLYRAFPTGDRKLLYESKVVTSSTSPTYKPFPMELSRMGTANVKDDYSILVELWYVKSFGEDRLLGAALLTVDDLRQSKRFPLLVYQEGSSHRLQQVAPGSAPRGSLVVAPADVTHTKTFSEYLEDGYEINLAVSVDFTASNRPPSDPLSLHRCDDQNGKLDNQYTRSILSVGPILMQYDKDKRVPVYGFGAATPITGPNNVSHFFPLNFRPDANVKDVAGIMEAYQLALPQLTFGGPTNFAPTVKSITRDAREASNVYTILLILTDGEITDMDQTIDAIVEADDAPLSIIIVGVGNGCDFHNMVRLDCDDGFLEHRNGRVSRRDLVQFVPMRHFISKSPQELASAVLEEVPRQFVEWSALRR